jgi:hypothetical protein
MDAIRLDLFSYGDSTARARRVLDISHGVVLVVSHGQVEQGRKRQSRGSARPSVSGKSWKRGTTVVIQVKNEGERINLRAKEQVPARRTRVVRSRPGNGSVK